jgi:alkylation response protein AidB-like acyl-CoA dehydrogenase
MVGAAERVYEMTIDYSHHRVQFGQSISRFQRVQDHVINIRNHVDAARLTTQEALERLERNDPQAEKYISLAKALTSEGFYQSCEAAHHVHAGIGSVKNYGLYLYTKASHSLYHYLGSPDMHEERVGELLAAEPV